MILQDDAVAIARARAMARGWGLCEPVSVTERRDRSGKSRSFCVVSDPTMHGTKARFTIDAAIGAIIDEGYLPR